MDTLPDEILLRIAKEIKGSGQRREEARDFKRLSQTSRRLRAITRDQEVSEWDVYNVGPRGGRLPPNVIARIVVQDGVKSVGDISPDADLVRFTESRDAPVRHKLDFSRFERISSLEFLVLAQIYNLPRNLRVFCTDFENLHRLLLDVRSSVRSTPSFDPGADLPCGCFFSDPDQRTQTLQFPTSLQTLVVRNVPSASFGFCSRRSIDHIPHTLVYAPLIEDRPQMRMIPISLKFACIISHGVAGCIPRERQFKKYERIHTGWSTSSDLRCLTLAVNYESEVDQNMLESDFGFDFPNLQVLGLKSNDALFLKDFHLRAIRKLENSSRIRDRDPPLLALAIELDLAQMDIDSLASTFPSLRVVYIRSGERVFFELSPDRLLEVRIATDPVDAMLRDLKNEGVPACAHVPNLEQRSGIYY